MNVIKCFCVFTFAFVMNAEVVANTLKVFTAAGLAVKEDIKVDFGEGIGETKDEALKEAIRDVLQRVVGTYVDSDFRVENDKIIKDQIITHSNGFIERYKIMDTDQAPDGRGIQVTIKAWVKIRDFVNRMKGIAPAQRVKVDGLLLNNELENKHSAEKLIENVFEKLDPINDLLEVKLVTNIKPIVQDSTDDSVTLRYIFIVKYSYENYYKKFLPRMMSVLDQVAVKPPRDFGLNAKMRPIKLHPRGSREEKLDDVNVSAFGLSFDGSSFSFRYKDGGGGSRDRNSVIATVKIGKGFIKFREWLLSTRLKTVFDKLFEESFSHKDLVNVSLRLLDANGQELTMGNSLVSCHHLFGELDYSTGTVVYPEFMPSVSKAWHDHIVYDRFASWIDVVVAREDVSRIKSAEIKLDKKITRKDLSRTYFNLK